MVILWIIFAILALIGSGVGVWFLIIATTATYISKNNEPRNDTYNPEFDYSAKNIDETNK